MIYDIISKPKKKEFVDAAMRLFLLNGYDNTPINAIIESLEVSKGAFYHYFKSKEDLLNHIVSFKSEQVLKKIEPVVANDVMNSIEKLNVVFQDVIRLKADIPGIDKTLFQQWLKDENLILRHKMDEKNSELMAAEIEKIIIHGITVGMFRVVNSFSAALYLLKLSTLINNQLLNLITDRDFPEREMIVADMVAYFHTTVETILSCKRQSIQIYDLRRLESIISVEL